MEGPSVTVDNLPDDGLLRARADQARTPVPFATANCRALQLREAREAGVARLRALAAEQGKPVEAVDVAAEVRKAGSPAIRAASCLYCRMSLPWLLPSSAMPPAEQEAMVPFACPDLLIDAHGLLTAGAGSGHLPQPRPGERGGRLPALALRRLRPQRPRARPRHRLRQGRQLRELRPPPLPRQDPPPRRPSALRSPLTVQLELGG